MFKFKYILMVGVLAQASLFAGVHNEPERSLYGLALSKIEAFDHKTEALKEEERGVFERGENMGPTMAEFRKHYIDDVMELKHYVNSIINTGVIKKTDLLRELENGLRDVSTQAHNFLHPQPYEELPEDFEDVVRGEN